MNKLHYIVLVALIAIAGFLFYKSKTGGTGTGGNDTGTGTGGNDTGTGTGGNDTGTGGGNDTGTGGGSTTVPRKVVIENNRIATNEYLTFTISGFSAGETVKVYVSETGGYFYTELDGNGGGTYSFKCGDPAGYYHLVISGTEGNAQAAFTVI